MEIIKKPKVRLVVFWAADAYESSITVPKKLWEEIKKGKRYEKKQNAIQTMTMIQNSGI
jgi:hypothetical protein